MHDFLNYSVTNLTKKEGQLVKEINRYGYAIVEGFLPGQECDRIVEEIDMLIQKYENQIWIDEHGSDHRVFGAEVVSSVIKDFHSDARLRSIGERLLSTKLTNYMTLAARLEAKQANLGSGGGWHRDSTYEHQYKSILYLTDVNEENGPFQFVEGSHKTGNVLRTIGYGVNNNRYTHDEIVELVQKFNWEIRSFTAQEGNRDPGRYQRPASRATNSVW